MLLTADVKDLVLRHLVENCNLGEGVGLIVDNAIGGISGDQLHAVLEQFGDLDLIDFDGYQSTDRSWVLIRVKLTAHDFIHEGGFYGKYELFKNNVEKLLLEVEKLEGTDANKDKKFTNIKGKIAEYLGYIATLSSATESIKNIFEKGH